MPPRSILRTSNVPKINYDSFERESNYVASIENGCNKNGEPTKNNYLEDQDKDSFNEKMTGKPIKELNEQSTVGPENNSSTDQRQSSGESVLEKPSDKHADEPSEQVNEEFQNYGRTHQTEDYINSFKKRVLKRKWQPEDNSRTDQGQSLGESFKKRVLKRKWQPEDNSRTDQGQSLGENVLKKPSYEHASEQSEQVNEESQNDSSIDQSEVSKNRFHKRELKRKWQPALTDGELALKYFRFMDKQLRYLYGPNGPYQLNGF